MRVPGCCGSKVLRIRIGIPWAAAGAMVCGVNDPSAEIGQFHGFVVGDLVDDRRLRNPLRIAAHHPFHIGPDVDGPSLQQGGEYGRRVIAAVTA